MEDYKDLPLKEFLEGFSLKEKEFLKKRSDDKPKKKPDDFRILDVKKPNVGT